MSSFKNKIVELNVGDSIKSFDFEPMPDRGDSYLEGTVTEINEVEGIVTFSVTKVVRGGNEIPATDETFPEWGKTAMPGTSFIDYDGRITLLEATK